MKKSWIKATMKIMHVMVSYKFDRRNTFHSKNTFLNADNGGASSWIGDGFCDDMNNNEACDYDDGDCCGLSTRKNFCIDCICKGKYFFLLNTDII